MRRDEYEADVFDEDEKLRPKTDRLDITPDDDAETEFDEQLARQLSIELETIAALEDDAEARPIDEDADEQPEKAKLKRELQAEALARLEDSARTQADFERVIDWWDKLDRNRERRERYHELSRSGDDLPLDYNVSPDELYFPNTMSSVLALQIRRGEFIDALFDCPYELHELVTDAYISDILYELPEMGKELLYLHAIRLFSSTKIAAIRGQTDRNIRKVRATLLKKVRKKLLAYLQSGEKAQQELTIAEKAFLKENSH